MKNNILIVAVIVIVVAGGGGFLGGMQYQKSKTPSFGGERGNFSRGQFGQGDDHQPGQDDGFRDRFSGQGRPVSGEIIAKDDESITVKVQDGGSKIVFISDTTTVAKTEEGTAEDLVEGEQVIVFGQENSDGSVTAQNIQIGTRNFRDQFQENQENN